MGSDNAKLVKFCKVKSYESDLHKNCTPVAICNYLQEIAWEHAEILNIGFDYLKSINKFWVLSRLQVKFYTYPKWSDEIQLVTWPKGIDGMFALRDFLIYSVENEKLVAATSSWLILDSEKHRPQRIDSADHPNLNVDTTDAYIHAPDKLSPLVNSKHIVDIKVRFTDIDVNKHVNNVKYIQWALDILSDKLLNGLQVKEMTVNFLAEASYNDTISVYLEEKGDSIFKIGLQNLNSGKEVCRIQFVI